MKIGAFLYRYRSLTPLLLIIILFLFSKPSIVTISIGFFISICGEIIRLISVGYTGLTTRSKNVQSDILVTNGPYGYVRNPIYLGNFFISLGVVISANTFFPWFIILYILLFSIQYFFIIRFEEEFLKERFAENYMKYIRNVPSFFPKLKAYLEGGLVRPDFKKALKSERTTMLSIILLYIVICAIYFWYHKT